MQRRRNVNFDKMVHLNSKTKEKQNKKQLNSIKRKRKLLQLVATKKKRKKTMSDMSSIQKWSHLVFQDVLGLR